MLYPSYREAFKQGKLREAARKAQALLASCTLCPRLCKVNRLAGEKGFCKTADKPKLCSYMPHHGEEPPISGTRGSGTIFFSHCTMSCSYCQNYEFSQEGEGKETDPEELAQIMLRLQEMGCHNINLVTPTHVMPQILMALLQATEAGLALPIVYNTSGYEVPEMVRLLDGIVDIYLPDMRYGTSEMAGRYSKAADYPSYSQRSLKEMHRQVGVATFTADGIIRQGVIVRHLVLPGGISGTEEIMEFIAKEISPDTYISLMSQYAPYYRAAGFEELARRITLQEYQTAQEILQRHGLCNGWTQDAHGLERFAGIHIKPFSKAPGDRKQSTADDENRKPQ